jgi:hypothetical protein
MSKLEINTGNADLISDISLLIEQSQRHIATQANSALTQLFWQIGKRINDEILLNKRADYGKQIVVTVSRQLETKYGRSFSDRNLRRMMQFATVFNDFKIVTPLATQLSWSHFIELFPLKTDEARMFYAQKSIEESWGKRALKEQIERKAFERNEIANTQLSNFKPELLLMGMIFT